MHFVVFTKPECPLCEGLVDKLKAIRMKAEFQPGFWSGMETTVRLPTRAILAEQSQQLHARVLSTKAVHAVSVHESSVALHSLVPQVVAKEDSSFSQTSCHVSNMVLVASMTDL